MNAFVLVMFIITGGKGATLTQEFSSFDACEKARVELLGQLTLTKPYVQGISVRAEGCFKK